MKQTIKTTFVASSLLLFAPSLYADTDYETLLQAIYVADQPGAAVAVSKGGETLYTGARGLAHIELPVQLEPDHMFRLASVTKQYVAAAILNLEEEGKLSVTDTLDRFLPDYPNADNITVHQLLNHTSGIKSYTGIENYMADERIRRDLDTQQLIDVFRDENPDFEPGEKFQYNNSGYVLLGAIIEAVTDMSWNQYIHSELLAPIGAPLTNYYPDDYALPGRVQGYHATSEGLTNAPWISMSQVHAAGALIATAPEVDRWQYHLHTRKIIGEDAYQSMITPDDVAGNYAYGLIRSSLKGNELISHGGGINGFATHALWLPENEISVVVLTNHIGHSIAPAVVSSRLAAIAMGQPFPHEKPTYDLTESELQHAVGTYRIDDDVTRTLQLKDGALVSQREGGAEFKVRPVSPTTFVFDTTLTYFELEIDGTTVTGVNFYQSGSDEAEYAEKISDSVEQKATVELTNEQQQRLVGSYELMPGFVITIRIEDSELVAQATGQQAFPVTAENAYTLSNREFGIRMEFDLDGDGPATQMTLHQAGQELPASRVVE